MLGQTSWLAQNDVSESSNPDRKFICGAGESIWAFKLQTFKCFAIAQDSKQINNKDELVSFPSQATLCDDVHVQLEIPGLATIVRVQNSDLRTQLLQDRAPAIVHDVLSSLPAEGFTWCEVMPDRESALRYIQHGGIAVYDEGESGAAATARYTNAVGIWLIKTAQLLVDRSEVFERVDNHWMYMWSELSDPAGLTQEESVGKGSMEDRKEQRATGWSSWARWSCPSSSATRA